jgi:hypothetical protein
MKFKKSHPCLMVAIAISSSMAISSFASDISPTSLTTKYKNSYTTIKTNSAAKTNYSATNYTTIANGTKSKPIYNIGVFYFPGWKDNQVGAAYALPWNQIAPYPERKPLIGYYPEGDISVAEQTIQQMHDYGINFVAYDWYWDGQKPQLNHAIQAHLAATNKNLVKISILWANHDTIPRTQTEFTSMVNYWITNYFNHPEYLRIDNKPVVFVFSVDALKTQAASFGTTTANLLNIANQMAKAAGYSGIYFVGGAGAGDTSYSYAPENGYNAISAYNYHYYTSGVMSHSYAELDQGYRNQWNWILQGSPLPYIIPMTAGWNKKPWGGSSDSLHDNSVSTPQTFLQHIQAAKTLMNVYPSKTMKTGIICCWNEFGEGSYIQPTVKYGTQYLEQIKATFAAP